MQDRFERAIAAFDRMNAADPRQLETDAGKRPFELVQAERLSVWIDRIAPNASEPLRLAARCQHLCRWQIPRSAFPEGRAGYLQWRTRLGRFHADEAGKVLRALGYDESTIDRVRRINLKQGLRSDPDVQLMEDALCLSFVEHELPGFSEKHEPAKVVEILQKTWKKMSVRARSIALELPVSERLAGLLRTALG